MSESAARRVACPRCTASTVFAPSNKWRPFCSERCAGIDLGAWASEAYRVASGPVPTSLPDADGVGAPASGA